MQEIDFKRRYPKVQVITHDDLDGYGAGSIIVFTLVNYLGYELDDIIVTNTNYENPFPVDSECNFVIVTDISISNRDLLDKILEFENLNKNNNILIWLDHHQTTVNTINSVPALPVPPRHHIINTKGSGTLLAYLFHELVVRAKNEYLAISGVEPAITMDYVKTHILKMIDESGPIIDQWLNEYNYVINSGMPYKGYIPLGVRMIDDYDRWIHNNRESILLNAAFYGDPAFPKDCKNRDLFYLVIDNGERLYDMVQIGRTIYSAEKLAFMMNLKNKGFIATPTKGYDNTQIICVENGYGNSSHFGFNLGMEFSNLKSIFSVTESGKYKVSIYDTCGRSAIKPQEICEKYGGGGHPQAAGFVTDKYPWTNIRPLTDEMKDYLEKEISETIRSMTKTGD